MRALVAECLGTALLLVAVVGSGIMGDRLSGGNVAIALLAGSIATGAALSVWILVFAPVSGAHFNPGVTLADIASRGWSSARVSGYVAGQVCGAVAGVAVAHTMFGEPLFSISQQARVGLPLMLSECVATFGLVSVIASCSRTRPAMVPFAVGAYIAAAYWFMASTSFANPAVTIARTLTDTFTGIRPIDAPGFIGAQFAGAGASVWVFRWLVPAAWPMADRPGVDGRIGR